MKSKLAIGISILVLSLAGSVHADVAEQGPASTLMFGATASQPAVRLAPPQPVPTVPLTVEQMIRDVWPDNLEERALKIAWRESNYQPRVHTYCCYGVFQIYLNVHRSWLNAMGIYTIEDLYDPLNNIKAAYQLYLNAEDMYGNGWQPWQT